MTEITFTKRAWEEYLAWQMEDKKTLRRINMILKDIDRNPFEGIAKPELLKYHKGCWSRRIDDKNRIVYKSEDDHILIIQCKGHYDDDP